MTNNVLVVENDGPEIVATNYWELPAAAAGKFLVSVNAGAFRLLKVRRGYRRFQATEESPAPGC